VHLYHLTCVKLTQPDLCVLPMVEHQPGNGEDRADLWVLRPNRSFSARQMVGFLLFVSTASVAVALLGWLYGNAFAPVFAMLELALLGLCFGLIAKDARVVEVIEVGSGEVRVSRLPVMDRVFSEGSMWVSVKHSAGGRVQLAARGKMVEIGAFLGDDERTRFASDLRNALAAAHRRVG
jgi:uncharacterized membrane protein